MTPDTLPFLEALTGQTNPVVTIGTLDDLKGSNRVELRRTFHNKVGDIDAELIRRNRGGAGIFYAVNETDLKGRKIPNFIRVRAVWQDDDDNVGWDNPLIDPSVTIQTSAKKFQRLFFTDTTLLDEFNPVQQRLIQDHGCDKDAKGIYRILRLPGYYHMKNPNDPFLVRTVGGIDINRTPWDIIKKIFPPVPIHKPVNQRAAGNGHFKTPGGVHSALLRLSPNMGYNDWLYVGMALHHATGGGEQGLLWWDTWSQKGDTYKPGLCAEKYATFKV